MLTQPKQTPSPTNRADEPRRGLTFRSFMVCIFALLLMGMWIEYQVCFMAGGPLAENSPPNGAISVLLIVVSISALLYAMRKKFGLVTAELVVIYTALLIAAPLMTQGLWHRIFGLIAALPHEADFKSYESLPKELWPHGDNLVINGQFKRKEEGFAVKGGALAWEPVTWKGQKYDAPVLDNGSKTDGRFALSFSIDRREGDKEILVPGESYLFSCLVNATDFQSTSYYYVTVRADDGRENRIIISSSATKPSLANPSGLTRIGQCPLIIPTELKDKLTITIGLNGPGKLMVEDVEFFNSEAIEGAYTGVNVISASKYKTLRDNERNFTIIKPDNMFSLAGLGYLLRGFIPLRQWVWPMFAWAALLSALFMGFLGFNVIMRKQWLEYERLTFPMNIFPRQFFGEASEDTGGILKSLFSNKIIWLGFAVCLPLVLLKGLHFYFPGIPTPGLDMMENPTTSLATYAANPQLKAYLTNFMVCLLFSLFSIALLMETDILFSIWVCFALFQFMNLFGSAFNWTRFQGYPYEYQQAVGAFIAFAVLALIAARRHLGNVFRHLVGRIKLDDSQEIVSYRTAFLMIIAAFLGLAIWGFYTKMGVLAALLFFGWILVVGLSASKLRAEAGMPWGYWSPYFGMFFISALGGFAIFKSSGVLVASIASGFMCVACFFFIAPAQVEMMELGRHFKIRPKDIGAGLWIGLLGGLLIGGFVLMCWKYGFGIDNLTYSWPYKQNWYFNTFRAQEAAVDQLVQNTAAGKPLAVIPANQPLNFIMNVDAKGVGIGFVVTFILAFLRNTFMWFPLHPLGYVVATSHFARMFWFTAFVAWLVRVVVQRIGGAHTIRRGLVPFAVGMFLACIVSIILFEALGFYLRSVGVTQIYCAWP